MNMYWFWFLMMSVAGLPVGPAIVSSWHIQENNSSITIQGTSNIGDYKCDCEFIRTNTPLHFSSENNSLIFNRNARFLIPVADFGCSNYLMTRDFRALLKFREYPHLIIEITELTEPDYRRTSRISGKVRVNIAGTIKAFPVDFIYRPLSHEEFVITTQIPVTFADFDLTPPKRFGGMIRIDNDITVNVSLKMTRSVSESHVQN